MEQSAGTNGVPSNEMGRNTVSRSEQPEKALAPIVVTLSGIVIDVSPEQPEKALAPMVVTLSGIVIAVSPEQPENADSPIFVTLFGIVIDVNPKQPEKADSTMLVTLSGIVNTKLVAEEKNEPHFGSADTFASQEQPDKA